MFLDQSDTTIYQDFFKIKNLSIYFTISEDHYD